MDGAVQRCQVHGFDETSGRRSAVVSITASSNALLVKPLSYWHKSTAGSIPFVGYVLLQDRLSAAVSISMVWPCFKVVHRKIKFEPFRIGHRAQIRLRLDQPMTSGELRALGSACESRIMFRAS